jgi:hypothetical protein
MPSPPLFCLFLPRCFVWLYKKEDTNTTQYNEMDKPKIEASSAAHPHLVQRTVDLWIFWIGIGEMIT